MAPIEQEDETSALSAPRGSSQRQNVASRSSQDPDSTHAAIWTKTTKGRGIRKGLARFMSKRFSANTGSNSYDPDAFIVKMYIPFHTQLDPTNTKFFLGMIDTAANINLVWVGTVEKLNLQVYPTRCEGKAFKHKFNLESFVLIPWHIIDDQGNPQNEYSTKFYICSGDDEDGHNFDFLLGTPWLRESGAVTRNPAVRFVQRLF